MSSRKTYVVPDRMHYDVFVIMGKNELPQFICSCSKENVALEIITSLVHEDKTLNFTGCTYKIRARPTVEHTIHSLRV